MYTNTLKSHEYEYKYKYSILQMYSNTNTLLFKCIRIRIHLKHLNLKNVTSDINIYLCYYIQYVYIITNII